MHVALKKKMFALGIAMMALGTGMQGISMPLAEAKVDFHGTFDLEAHRGGRDARPENTLYSYAYAIENGATSIECDMQLAADGEIVMSHNPILNAEVTRDAQGNFIANGKYDLRKMTVPEIQQYNVATIDPSTEYYQLHGRTQVNPSSAQVPTLRQLLELIKASGDKGILLNIELKSYPDPLQKTEHENNADTRKFLEKFNVLVKEYQMENRVVLQSFDWQALRMEKELNPQISLSAPWQEQPSWGKAAESLRAFDKEKSPWLGGLDIKDFKGDPVKAAKAIGADIISPYYMELNKDMVEEAHKLGMKVVPWTVNHESDMQMLYAMGVDGMISDKPWLLRSFLEKQGAKLHAPHPFASAYHLEPNHREVTSADVKNGADAAS